MQHGAEGVEINIEGTLYPWHGTTRMADRISEELDLLRNNYPSLEYRADGQWVRLPRVEVPPSIWDSSRSRCASKFRRSHPTASTFGQDCH